MARRHDFGGGKKGPVVFLGVKSRNEAHPQSMAIKTQLGSHSCPIFFVSVPLTQVNAVGHIGPMLRTVSQRVMCLLTGSGVCGDHLRQLRHASQNSDDPACGYGVV